MAWRGPWGRRSPPLPGELLSSCLARNAYAHGSTPRRFFGLCWPGDPVWTRDFDRDPASLVRGGRPRGGPDWLDDLARRLEVPRGAVEGATLAGWRRRFGEDLRKHAGETPLLLTAGLNNHGRRRHALQFCPGCLAEGRPFFRKSWRLGFVLDCEEHGRPLLDACPHCGAPAVPHRSATSRLVGCHSCGRSLASVARHSGDATPDPALRLQFRLCSILCGEGAGQGGPLGAGEAFATVRTLIGACAPARSHARLRASLCLPALGPDATRRSFEQARRAVRAPWLETVATWLDDWPRNFLGGAEGMGASQRKFARSRLPPSLAEQVARLPRRHCRAKGPWEPLLDEPVLRRLRRTDKATYRALRASRIMAAIGRA